MPPSPRRIAAGFGIFPVLCAALGLVACAHVATPASGTGAQRLVGAWRLVLFEDLVDGRATYPFGENASGYLIYTADGHMAGLIADADLPSCVPPALARYSQLPPCSPAQMQRTLEGSVAYWGTYSLDEAEGVVIHHVERDLTSGLAGTDQRRPYRLEGDRLVIGDGKTWKRVFERAR
jgi:Lipocalin-like domain